MIVVDTGPIVAMANRRDQDHERCTKLLTTYDGPLLLPEPLLTEVGYMLSTRAGARAEANFLRDVADGTYQLISSDKDDLRRTADLVEQYSKLPLGTADACVVAMAERFRTLDIATLNARDFKVIRPQHGKSFTLHP